MVLFVATTSQVSLKKTMSPLDRGCGLGKKGKVKELPTPGIS